MSGPRRPPNNRQRVEDYYGVHDTGIGARPAQPAQPAPPPPRPTPPRPTPPQGPPAASGPAPGQAPGQPQHGRVMPPPAPPTGGAPSAAEQADTGRPKPDPLTDPLTSETFQGVQPEPDTFGTGVGGGFGYSAEPSSRPTGFDGASGFDGGFDQFAPPKFEPPKFDAPSYKTPSSYEPPRFAPRADGAAGTSDILDEPDDSYIDVDVIDVEHVEIIDTEPQPEPVQPQPVQPEPADAEPAGAEVTVEPEPAVTEAEVTVEPESGPGVVAEPEQAPDAEAVTETATPAPEPATESAPAPETDARASDLTAEATPDEPSPAGDGEDDQDGEPTAPVFRGPLAIDAYPYTQIDETYVDPATLPEPKEPGEMADLNESLNEAMSIDGALGVALVDAGSGMALATAGDPADFNLEVAAAGNSALVQALGRTLSDLDLDDHIEDMLITLGTQYQIVRPIRRGADDLFLYLVLDRSRANLAMARFRLTKLAEALEV